MANFSKPPQDTLLSNLERGYVGLHVEQGVPVLDRDLNLLGDLIAASVRRVVARYIGDGVAAGRDGFRIAGVAGDNDFRILAGVGDGRGSCLAGGLEATIEAPMLYSDQDGVPALATPDSTQPDPRFDAVYLDVFLTQVEGADDAELLNPDDLGLQTSVRLKPAWRVRVAEGVPVPDPEPGHVHTELARLRRDRGEPRISDITDLRRTGLNLAAVEARLSSVESLFLPALNASPNEFNPKFGLPGTNVTLLGRNLDVGTVTVRFGTTPAAIFGSPTSTQLIASVPVMAPGPVKITVETDSGSVTSSDNFTVLAPPPPVFSASPNQFNPKFGGAGTEVTLFGNHFNIGTVSVRFGTTSAAIVGTPTATQIVAAVPTMSSGPVKITVETDGGPVTSDDDFTVI